MQCQPCDSTCTHRAVLALTRMVVVPTAWRWKHRLIASHLCTLAVFMFSHHLSVSWPLARAMWQAVRALVQESDEPCVSVPLPCLAAVLACRFWCRPTFAAFHRTESTVSTCTAMSCAEVPWTPTASRPLRRMPPPLLLSMGTMRRALWWANSAWTWPSRRRRVSGARGWCARTQTTTALRCVRTRAYKSHKPC
jgi:hypothetical protein